MSLNDSSLHGCSGGPAEQTAAGYARLPGNDECRWYVAPACLLELGCLGVWQTATAPQQLAVQPHRTRQAVRDAFGTAGCPRCSSAAAIGVAEAPSSSDIDPADGRRPLRPRGALARSGRGSVRSKLCRSSMATIAGRRFRRYSSPSSALPLQMGASRVELRARAAAWVGYSAVLPGAGAAGVQSGGSF